MSHSRQKIATIFYAEAILGRYGGGWVFWERRICGERCRNKLYLEIFPPPVGSEPRSRHRPTGIGDSLFHMQPLPGLACNWRLANVSIRRLARPMGRWCRTGVFAFARCQVPAFSFVEWASLPPPANGLLDAVLRDQPHNHAVMDVVGLGDALHRLTGVTPCNRF